MIGSYSSISFFLHTIVVLFSTSIFCNTFASLIQNSCCPDQRDALVEFKNEFKIRNPRGFPDLNDRLVDVTCYPKTKSWGNSSDCCYWDGITCDTKSGKVVGVDLSCSCLHGRLQPNSSLFRLQHLRKLNLAYNNFTASSIPAEFRKFTGLEILNLSQSSFSGQVPIEILQLTNLASLDLSSSSSPSSSLFIKSPYFLRVLAQNLKSMRELDMSFVNIASEIPHEFSNMWSLRMLILKSCNLSGEFPSSVFQIPNLQSITLDNNKNLRSNLPVFHGNNSMKILSLRNTSLSGEISSSLGNLSHLSYLDLSYNYLSGKIPFSLGNLSHLSYLDLSDNSIIGEIPSSIGKLKQLRVFDVMANKISGKFPSAVLNLTKLRSLLLHSNQFTGFLPPNISQLSTLKFFDASKNYFTGAIPSSLFKISSLTVIYLYNNNLNDLVGIENISLLPNLTDFYIDDNSYRVGSLDLNVFSPLKQLKRLGLSGIPLLTANITSDSDFPSHLLYLYLSGCNLTRLPEFIKHQRNLKLLDFSDNKIKGQVPDWLWRLTELSHLFLSNNFIGEIPQSMCGLSSLYVLDLSNNNLRGSIPRCLGTHMSSLSVLDLGKNSFSGVLPDIFINAKELRTLDVSHNRLEGKLPASLTGCSALEILNVESNKIDDTFPFWLHSLPKLQVLVLRSNKFHGTLYHSDGVWFGFPQLKIIDVSHNIFVGALPSDYFLNWTAISSKKDGNIKPGYIGQDVYYTSLVLMSKGVSMTMGRILKIDTAIDFSGNQLHGQIPDSIGILKELRMLNLSRNAFTGHIPSSLANLTNLESLDLSQNKISGEIPPALGTLSSLAWINVSHNQLVGPIPQGTQFHTQNCSSYQGNPGLYGPSLKDVCGDIHAPTPPQPEPLETKEEDDEEWFSWIAARLGLVPGVVFGVTIGYIVTSYKHDGFIKTFGRNKHRSTGIR